MANEPKQAQAIEPNELDPECLPQPSLVEQTANIEPEEEETEGTPWQEWDAGTQTHSFWQPTRGRLLRALEWAQLRVERVVNRIVGVTKLNPFYYTGELAMLLLLIITITGIPLMLFFQPGFDSSYLFVSRIENQFLARIVRALHRYASDAFMIVSMVHAFRLLFLGRFRGPRWLAWVSGVGMLVIAWIVGVTGYGMVWDIRAQVILQTIVDWMRNSAAGVSMTVGLVGGMKFNDDGMVVIILMFLVHLALSLAIGGAFILHIWRLQRPRWLPNRQWTAVGTLALIFVSAAIPVGMLPKASLEQIPGAFQFDPLFLFFIPLATFGWAPWAWLGIALVLIGWALVPWTPQKHKPGKVVIDKERCTGCTKCALDCPYKAIRLETRTDGKPHKYIAIENPDLCVGCGICVGSCDIQAVSLTDLPAQMVWQSALAQVTQARTKLHDVNAPLQVVLTCERHAMQGARYALEHPQANVEIIPVTCVGQPSPDLIGRMLGAGASEVKVIGCPPDDCSNREGNVWQDLRLARKRPPRLREIYVDKPIARAWLAPDEFQRAAAAPVAQTAAWNMTPKVTLRNFIPAFVLLAVAFVVMIALTTWQYQPYPSDMTRVQVAMPNAAHLFSSFGEYPDTRYPTQLTLQINGETKYEKIFTVQELRAGNAQALFHAESLTPGDYHIRLAFSNPQQDFTLLLYDKTMPIQAGQILTLSDRQP